MKFTRTLHILLNNARIEYLYRPYIKLLVGNFWTILLFVPLLQVEVTHCRHTPKYLILMYPDLHFLLHFGPLWTLFPLRLSCTRYFQSVWHHCIHLFQPSLKTHKGKKLDVISARISFNFLGCSVDIAACWQVDT